MFKSLFLLGGLLCSIGLGVNNVSVSNDLHYETNETIEFKASPKFVSYNDENYSITLTADELNNYQWNNLVNYFISLAEDTTYLSDTEMQYSSVVYTLSYLGDVDILSYGHENSYINLSFDTCKWDFNTNIGSFESPIYWVLNVNNYTSIKTAIEQDISANSESMPQASDLFGYITQGATQFASALGQAFTSITAMIWDSTNSAPTFLGMVLLLSIGAGLIYLAFNIIRGLVRRLRG